MKDFKNILNNIIKTNSINDINDDILIRACEIYKSQSNDFYDSYDYNVRISKSLYDSINGIDVDDEIIKAIIPGQTKVINNTTYIYTMTPHAKQPYGWRVYNKKKVKPTISPPVNSSIPDTEEFDIKNYKVIQSLGGSTGARLVENKNGDKFVIKTTNKVDASHVANEYLANKLYKILGLNSLDCKLYKGKETVLLSKFIPLTRVPKASDYDELAKGFVVDALLANWDVYQNDNCLIDSANNIIRVDNGGSLKYRAQGGAKDFTSDVKEFDSMRKYNPQVVAGLSDQDYVNQIDDVLKKKDKLINYLSENNEDDLKQIFEKRFDSLELIKKDLLSKIQGNNIKSPTSSTKIYNTPHQLTDKELDDIWKKQTGIKAGNKIYECDDVNGWKLLSDICKAQGFDSKPKIIDDYTFLNSATKYNYQIFRGIDGKRGNNAGKTAEYISKFKTGDDCFYGQYGIYGEGIYFHINDEDKVNFKKSTAYEGAVSYSDKGKDSIIHGYLENDAKIGDVDELKKEIFNRKDLFSKKDQIEITKLEKILTIAENALDLKEKELTNFNQNIEKDIKEKMHYNEKVLSTFQNQIDGEDWSKMSADGKKPFLDFDVYVKNLEQWVTSNGGKVKKENGDIYIFKVPNSSETFLFSKYQWDNNSIKKKNYESKPYNYPLVRFKSWLLKEHYGKIQDTIEETKEKSKAKVDIIKKEITAKKLEVNSKKYNLDNFKANTTKANNIKAGDNIMDAIYYSIINNGSEEAIGIYAAAKGYDAIIKKHVCRDPHTNYMIVLNRGKVIAKQ